MPLVAANDPLAESIRRLRREVADHKSALNFHRRALAGAKDALARLEAALDTRSPRRGEGDIHGPDSDRRP